MMEQVTQTILDALKKGLKEELDILKSKTTGESFSINMKRMNAALKSVSKKTMKELTWLEMEGWVICYFREILKSKTALPKDLEIQKDEETMRMMKTYINSQVEEIENYTEKVEMLGGKPGGRMLEKRLLNKTYHLDTEGKLLPEEIYKMFLAIELGYAKTEFYLREMRNFLETL